MALVATCDSGFIIDNGNRVKCSQWVFETYTPSSLTIDDIYTVLSSIDDFDLVVTGSLISGYLLFFTFGYIAATTFRIMKKV